MSRTHLASALAALATLVAASGPARAHGDDPMERGAPESSPAAPGGETPGTPPIPPAATVTPEQLAKPVTGPEAKKTPLRWHGSTLLFDQSVTSQTIGVGRDYQSYNPTYE